MILNKNCPACGAVSETLTVSRKRLITMQNYIYREREKARAAPVGDYELYFCRICELAFNAAFDAALMNYDEGYTAYIPSAIFEDYYREIARFLGRKFALENSLIVDIACGKGDFLKLLCESVSRARGLGVDPSYELSEADERRENVRFVQDVFKEKYIVEMPALVMCRHAFDQIENPLEFLKSVRRSVSNYKEVPFFIEVGDLEWTIENDSFADFCYERCSFFSAESLENILRLAGFAVEKIEKAFGGQYLWAYGAIRRNDMPLAPENLQFEDESNIGEKLLAYAAREKNLVAGTKAKLIDFKAEGYAAAVWGIATKGVVFCNLIDADNKIFDYCIDINPLKLNCFVPHTGQIIDAPEVLREADFSKILIVVMNPNYLREIADYCRKLQINARFMDALGNEMEN